MKILFSCLLFLVMLDAFSEELKPYRVYLKPGTVLTRLSDKTNFTIDKGIYANVLETNSLKRDLFVVYNKEGKATYETTAIGVVDIEKDIQLLPNVNAEISYPPPSTLKLDNKHAFFDTQFNLHFDKFAASPLNSIYNQELNTSLSSRYELRTLYVSQLPVNFGFGINYQTASWKNDNDDESEEINLTILSLGPQLQRYVYQEDNMIVSIHFGAEYAPIYRTTSGDDAHEKYTAMLLDLGAEVMWETDYGKWLLGAHLRRHDLTLESSTRVGVNETPRGIIINSIGAMLGYKYEWDL